MCRAFILQHYLPIVFAVALAWALAFPAPGQAVVGITVSYASEMGIWDPLHMAV